VRRTERPIHEYPPAFEREKQARCIGKATASGAGACFDRRRGAHEGRVMAAVVVFATIASIVFAVGVAVLFGVDLDRST
jgi:hypothetical protein